MGIPYKLGEVQNGANLASGIYPGVQPVEALMWQDGENILFREGHISKKRKEEVYFDAGATVTALVQARVNNLNRVYTGHADSIKYYENGTLTTIGTGFSQGTWDLETWGSWLFATNNYDVPQIWKNTGTLAAVSGLPFNKAKHLFKIGPFLLAANTSNDNRNFEWCREGDPEDWDTDAIDTSAGNLTVNEFSGEIVAVCKLGDYEMLYSADEMALVKYIGGTGIFGYKHYPTGGAAGRRAAVCVGNMNFVIQRSMVYQTNGTGVQSIDDGKIQQWLQDNVDWDDTDSICGYHDELLGLVKWTVPLLTGSSTTVAYDYTARTWTKDTFAMGACEERTVGNYPIASSGQSVYQVGTGVDSTTSWSLTSKPFDFGYQQNWKWLDMLRIAFEGTITLRIGVQEKLSDTMEWLSLGTLTDQNAIHREAVYTTVEFSGTGDFTISEMQMLGQIGSYAQ